MFILEIILYQVNSENAKYNKESKQYDMETADDLYLGTDFEKALKIFEDGQQLIENYKETETGVSFYVGKGIKYDDGDCEITSGTSQVKLVYIDKDGNIEIEDDGIITLEECERLV